MKSFIYEKTIISTSHYIRHCIEQLALLVADNRINIIRLAKPRMKLLKYPVHINAYSFEKILE